MGTWRLWYPWTNWPIPTLESCALHTTNSQQVGRAATGDRFFFVCVFLFWVFFPSTLMVSTTSSCRSPWSTSIFLPSYKLLDLRGLGLPVLRCFSNSVLLSPLHVETQASWGLVMWTCLPRVKFLRPSETKLFSDMANYSKVGGQWRVQWLWPITQLKTDWPW